jgi:serine/threonine-protein kinase
VQVGRYQVEAAVAEGGFGVVYRATDEGRGRTVALKLLHAELTHHPGAVERFEREARLVALVRHPNVVDVLELGLEHRGQPYFVMEWLDGTDLRRRLAEQGRLAPAAALDVLAGVAAALDAAHAVGVVHRDVKASNVFLAGPRPVLLDFGVAKLLDDTRPGLTSSRHVIGTPPCMAPEQILGAPVDARTDVYGLGVLAFQALTGGLPFVHDSAAMVMDMHVHAPPPRASARAPLPPAVDEVLAAALAKAPGARPASAGALVAALARALGGERSGEDRPAAAVRVRFSLSDPVDPDGDAALDALEAAATTVRAVAADEALALRSTSGNAAVLTGAADACARAAERLRRELGAIGVLVVTVDIRT